uniref:NADH dehydrogenase subunit 3 n=1 Tax=Closteromerus claviger TaxID=904192 RepID=E3VSZ8_CLOCA|nr:NADH dehydrogenase subunit 3 [Closteromerus claviger]
MNNKNYYNYSLYYSFYYNSTNYYFKFNFKKNIYWSSKKISIWMWFWSSIYSTITFFFTIFLNCSNLLNFWCSNHPSLTNNFNNNMF